MITNIILSYLLASAFVGGIVLVYKFLQWLESILN
jgi:hypothetical protein